jgi:hypothetical protein
MFALLSRLVTALVFSSALAAWEQEPATIASENQVKDSGAALVVGHPFSAIKYARQVRALPNGTLQFIQNERYPVRIARDADGRLMMQVIDRDDLQPECDRLDLPVLPVCPVWSVIVFDPVARAITHWPAGARAAHVSIDFPLSEAYLEETAHTTGELPDVPPDFGDEDGKLSTSDLGDKSIEGIQVQGVRWTLKYTKTESGKTIHLVRIHEVWVAPELKLIVQVVDGDPDGVETVWGLEKMSLSPDSSLFQPPVEYESQHHHSDRGIEHDIDYLKTWFAK